MKNAGDLVWRQMPMKWDLLTHMCSIRLASCREKSRLDSIN